MRTFSLELTALVLPMATNKRKEERYNFMVDIDVLRLIVNYYLCTVDCDGR